MSTQATASSAVSQPPRIEELRRAWRAIQAGAFRGKTYPAGSDRQGDQSLPVFESRGRPAGSEGAMKTAWSPLPGETLLPVVGCLPSSGATTLAVAIATAAVAASPTATAPKTVRPATRAIGGTPADLAVRVLECCARSVSGLSAASDIELGLDVTECWRLGGRRVDGGQVELQRLNLDPHTANEVPTPPAGSDEVPSLLTVLDCGWTLGHLTTGTSWIGAQIGARIGDAAGHAIDAAGRVVVTTRATVPGMRRLEDCLDRLGPDRVVAAVLGPRPSRWPTAVRHSMSSRLRQNMAQGRLVAITPDTSLAVRGLDAQPLPPALLRNAASVLDLLLNPALELRLDVDHAAGGSSLVQDTHRASHTASHTASHPVSVLAERNHP